MKKKRKNGNKKMKNEKKNWNNKRESCKYMILEAIKWTHKLVDKLMVDR